MSSGGRPRSVLDFLQEFDALRACERAVQEDWEAVVPSTLELEPIAIVTGRLAEITLSYSVSQASQEKANTYPNLAAAAG